MSKATRNKAIKSLEKYIWSLQGKCDSITKINKELISQYCRFIVLCEETSLELIGDPTQEEIDNLTKNYEKFNKIALNLYKTLKFDAIKDELANYSNPLEQLLKEEEEDGDF